MITNQLLFEAGMCAACSESFQISRFEYLDPLCQVSAMYKLNSNAVYFTGIVIA